MAAVRGRNLIPAEPVWIVIYFGVFFDSVEEMSRQTAKLTRKYHLRLHPLLVLAHYLFDHKFDHRFEHKFDHTFDQTKYKDSLPRNQLQRENTSGINEGDRGRCFQAVQHSKQPDGFEPATLKSLV